MEAKKTLWSRLGACLFALGVVACDQSPAPTSAVSLNSLAEDGLARLADAEFEVSTEARSAVQREAALLLAYAYVQSAPGAQDRNKLLWALVQSTSVADPQGCANIIRSAHERGDLLSKEQIMMTVMEMSAHGFGDSAMQVLSSPAAQAAFTKDDISRMEKTVQELVQYELDPEDNSK